MALTSIHIEPCKTESSEYHNLRQKPLDYVRAELSGNNIHCVEQRIAPTLASAKERYKATTGQRMQDKQAPIREGVVVIKPDTTLDDLQRFANRLHEKWGIKTIQIHIHRDEGHTDKETGQWVINQHAHMVFDWTQENGKCIRLKPVEYAQMQTILAECLGMERGVSSDKKHLDAVQYKVVKAQEALKDIAEEHEMTQKKLDMAKKDVKQTESTIRAKKAEFDQISAQIEGILQERENIKAAPTAVAKIAKLLVGKKDQLIEQQRQAAIEEVKALHQDLQTKRSELMAAMDREKQEMDKHFEYISTLPVTPPKISQEDYDILHTVNPKYAEDLTIVRDARMMNLDNDKISWLLQNENKTIVLSKRHSIYSNYEISNDKRWLPCETTLMVARLQDSTRALIAGIENPESKKREWFKIPHFIKKLLDIEWLLRKEREKKYAPKIQQKSKDKGMSM